MCVHLWYVVSPFLADSMEPSKTKEGLGSCRVTSFTYLLGSPWFICSQQILLQTRWRLDTKRNQWRGYICNRYICYSYKYVRHNYLYAKCHFNSRDYNNMALLKKMNWKKCLNLSGSFLSNTKQKQQIGMVIIASVSMLIHYTSFSGPNTFDYDILIL